MFKINKGEVESSSYKTEIPWHIVLQIPNRCYNKILTIYEYQKDKEDMTWQLSAIKH